MKSGFLLQLIFMLTAIPSWSADTVWLDQPDEKNMGRKIGVAKDYYADKYSFDTTKECTGRCFAPGTEVFCSGFKYVKDPAKPYEYQFCKINKIILPNGTAQGTNKNLWMISGTILLDADGKRKKYTYNSPKNTTFTGTPEVAVAPKPKPKPPPLPPPKPKVTEAAATCEDCEPEGAARRLIKDIKPVVSVPNPTPSSVSKKQIGDAISSKVGRSVFSPACLSFINANGDLGPFGKSAIAAIKKVGWGCFSGEGSETIDVSSVCPNFKSFDKDTKEYFWAWTFASMAFEESSCDPRERNPHGANDIADGLMQMEYSVAQRKDAGRNKNFCPYTAVDSKNITFQMECSASILQDTVCRSRNKSLTNKGGYWAKLRGTSTWWYKNKRGKSIKVVPEISWHIMKFPGCAKK